MKAVLSLKNLLIVVILFTFKSVDAQYGMYKRTVNDFIHSVKGNADDFQPFNISTKSESFFINNFTIKYEDETHYSLLSESGDVHLFSLLKSTDGYQGILINKDQTKGYKISEDKFGELLFTEAPISELIFTCSFEENSEKADHKTFFRGFIGNSNTESDVYKLESNSGAEHCIYLDFDGEPGVYFYGWNNHTFTVANFSDTLVRQIWDNVAEDFIPFNVNVTTNRAVFDSYPTSKKGWAAFASFGITGWLGVAQNPSFGTGIPCLVNVPPTPFSHPSLWLTPSHELGHTFGLTHHGGPAGPYYPGHGEYVPIMGNSHNKVSQWSKGEYSGATNTQDDIAIIGGQLGYSEDDYINVNQLIIDPSNAVNPLLNNGIINSRNDVDTFKFVLAGSGTIDVTAQAGFSLPNLDIKLSLFDIQGNLIASNNPIGKRSATIYENVSPGTYFLVIDGDQELTVNTGWSDYGSMGYYELTGTITGTETVADDIALAGLSSFGDVCAKEIIPEITVKNNGTNAVSSLHVEVYIDNNLTETLVFNENIIAGGSKIISLPAITQTGTHSVEIKINLAPGIDQVSFNNSQTTSYTLTDGNEIEFSTDLLSFNGSDPLSWVIKEEITGTTVLSSSDVQLETSDPSVISQSFCINNGCYDIELNGGFNLCNQYNSFSPGGTYLANDIVELNGVLYKAKWWTQNSPPGAEWTNIGNCNPTTEYHYSLTNKSELSTYFNESSDDYNGSYNFNFCTVIPTNTEPTSTKQNLKIYPNPATTSFVVNTDQSIDYLTVRNTLGQVMLIKYNVANTTTINTSDLTTGLYFVEVSSNGVTEVKTLVIK